MRTSGYLAREMCFFSPKSLVKRRETRTVSFTLPRSGVVALDVYDVVGRKVRTLLDRAVPAGERRITWEDTGVSSRNLLLQA